MALSPGTLVGPYAIIDALGAGGMGEVYRARDGRLGRDVALKVLPTPAVVDADRLHRFEQEARATAALNHPNILALYDVGRSEYGPFLVTELLEGETLRASFGRGAMPARKATEVAVQLARGLAAAHERGMVHRDLKPDNVFVTSSGHVKILDFGLVRLTEVAPAALPTDELPTVAPATSPGVVLGTVGYMAPEQVLGHQVDHRADLFALGVILHELLSGRRAFARDSAAETMTAILKEEPPSLGVGSMVPFALQRIVSRCLEKAPSARFQSAVDLAFALETVTTQSGPAQSGPAQSGAAEHTLVPSASRSTRVWTRLRWVVVPLSLVIGAAGAWLTVRNTPVAAPVTRFQVSLPESWRADLRNGRPLIMSPDGRSLAGLAVSDDGRSQLFVRAFDAPDVRLLEGTRNAGTFFWSPDSRSLAFFEGAQLKRIDLTGGVPTVICEDPTTFSRGGAWTPGDIIVYGSTEGLKQVPAGGGTPTILLPLAPDESFHVQPTLTPDGKSVLVIAGVGDVVRVSAARRVIASRIGSPERKVLFEGDQFAQPVGLAAGHVLFVRGAALMAQPFDTASLSLSGTAVALVDQVQPVPNVGYWVATAAGQSLAYLPASSSNVNQLAWYDRTGRQTSLVGDRGDYTSLELAPDQQRAVVAVLDQTRRGRDIWLFDLARAVRTRFTFEAGDERTAVWTPAGDRLILNRQEKSTERDLFIRAADGSGVESAVLVDGSSKDAMSVSPDGRILLYRVSSKRNDIWMKPLDGSGEPKPFIATEFDENYGRFSPDGRWVAYSSNESGRPEVYVVPFPGPGGKWQISIAGGELPRWRGDGRELFYLAQDKTLMAVTVDAGTTAVRAGEAAPLFRTAVPTMVGYNYAVSADGQRFLINTSVDVPPPLAVIENWPTLLKR
jgi:eukaryotic-like serine/threonine-protein kinase